MSELTVVAQRDTTWPAAYRMRMKADGRVLAIGLDPVKATASRLVEEGLATDETAFCVHMPNGEDLHATVGEAITPPEPEPIPEPEPEREPKKPVKAKAKHKPVAKKAAKRTHH